ncbi:MAG: hypothetical protein DI585_04855 [Pseudomonas fluorescens]|nr:MAG: hypothetical protein DI585_04855 [Pseudomonas fluorescens]
MLLKLANYVIVGIAVFYAAEITGVIERGRYFPTLPRLEASASDPMAWFGAAQWGVSQITTAAKQNEITAPIASAEDLNLQNVTTFAKRLEAKRDATLNSFGYTIPDSNGS